MVASTRDQGGRRRAPAPCRQDAAPTKAEQQRQDTGKQEGGDLYQTVWAGDVETVDTSAVWTVPVNPK
jgi:hypothetical protein